MLIGRIDVLAMKLLLALLAVAGCASVKPTDTSEAPTYLGIAEMRPDRTIVLTMYIDGTGRDAYQVVEYKPTDKYYELVMKHVGGLKPGEQKPVRPWRGTLQGTSGGP